ncbi:Rv3235 family protein [Fodinicola acaciae]|uniref:Rv3235 family protein n=1 Tax=Fodinicola acaciae TaxID=2681555 RepID=UPI0013D0CC4D|nr:Rv3235 family protein [Fodinicola acaciae]
MTTSSAVAAPQVCRPARHRRRIEVRRAPCTEPPYSPVEHLEERHLRLVGRPAPPIEAYADPLPFETDEPRTTPKQDPVFAPQPTPRRQLPCPRTVAKRLTQAIVEVMAGRRPVQQLMPVTSERVYAALLTRLAATSAAPVPGQPRQSRVPGQVSTVRVDEPADGVAEACAVVTHHGRSRAIALRLEGYDGRWRCTYLQLI